MVEISLTPRPEMIDGNELLIDVEGFLSRFVVYPSEAARIAHVLWIGHAWFMEHWESTPRIAFLSPEPGSGKSRALEVTEPLVPRPVHAVNATPAYLFRKVSDESGPPTVLFDEIDTLFGPKAKDNEEVRGMLNAGHRRGSDGGPLRDARQDGGNRRASRLLCGCPGRPGRSAGHNPYPFGHRPDASPWPQ